MANLITFLGGKIPTEGVQMHPLLLFSKPCPCGIRILTITGKSKWNASTINGILANEKYTGCARIHKTFTPDVLTKKLVKNTGQVPSYFVEQSHPAIIAPETFEMVQAEVARREHKETVSLTY